ncbi:MAG TPA: hypothetical protein VK509_10225 [Polyangiales bacterium]|nr:hypothetical protein [Polyangiales bacterium]
MSNPTALRLVHVDGVPYWDSADGYPCGTDVLTSIGLRAAWRIAMTWPDIMHAGLGKELARICIDVVDRTTPKDDSAQRWEIDLAIGIAQLLIDHAGWSVTDLLDLPWRLQKSQTLLCLVGSLVEGRHGRGANFEEIAFFLQAIHSDEGHEVAAMIFDEMLTATSKLLVGVDPEAEYRDGIDVSSFSTPEAADELPAAAEE